LPRYHAALQRVADERKLAEILLEAGDAPPDSNGKVYRRSADGHNRERARGIPIVGRVSGGGAVPGADPVAALLQKEAHGRRRRRATGPSVTVVCQAAVAARLESAPRDEAPG
jgi:hypothetical protein